jgi:hypothetical protein
LPMRVPGRRVAIGGYGAWGALLLKCIILIPPFIALMLMARVALLPGPQHHPLTLLPAPAAAPLAASQALRAPVVREVQALPQLKPRSQEEDAQLRQQWPSDVYCCSRKSPWRCVEGGAELSAPAPARQQSIGFATFMSSHRPHSAVDLWASMQRYAFPGHDVHLFVFTDLAGSANFLPHPNVHTMQQGGVEWPFDTLALHFLCLLNIEWFAAMDYVLSIDPDMLLVQTLGEEVLGERIAALQPWFFGGRAEEFSYERRLAYDGSPYSSAFVAPEEGGCYFSSSLFGGSLVGFTSILQRTVALVHADLAASPPRLAVLQDESYLNRVYLELPPTVVLSPAFAYPSPPADEGLLEGEHSAAYKTTSGKRRFKPSILNLGKGLEFGVHGGMQPWGGLAVPMFISPPSAHKDTWLVQSPSAAAVAARVTFIVKAFERPTCIRRLLSSIVDSYPGASVVVLDDSESPLLAAGELRKLRRQLNLTYVHSEYDIGLSEGRNRMVGLVHTPLVLLLDDDFILPKASLGLEELLPALEGGTFDIAGGCVDSPQGSAWSYTFAEGDGVLTQSAYLPCAREATGVPPDYMTQSTACWRADSILNFFLARTEFLQSVPWDPRLKVGEHEDFFLRVKDAGGRVGMCRGVTAMNDNSCDSTPKYMEKRRRVFDYWVTFFMKRGLHRMVTAAGRYELDCECLVPRRPKWATTADQAALLAELPQYRTALDVSRRKLGSSHPETVRALIGLADMLTDLHKRSEAEALYREALQWSREQLKDGHPDRYSCIFNLADVLWEQGKLGEAEAVYLEATAAAERVTGGAYSAESAEAARGLAGLWADQGKYALAESKVRALLVVVESEKGGTHHETIATYAELVRLLRLQGRHGEAEQLSHVALNAPAQEGGRGAALAAAQEPCKCAIDVKQDNIWFAQKI